MLGSRPRGAPPIASVSPARARAPVGRTGARSRAGGSAARAEVSSICTSDWSTRCSSTSSTCAARQPSPATTGSAASRVNGAANTARRAGAPCGRRRRAASGSTRSTLDRLVARSTTRGPPASTPIASASPSRICAGDEHAAACRGQLDGQRDPVEPGADLGHVGRVVVVRRKSCRPLSHGRRTGGPRRTARATATGSCSASASGVASGGTRQLSSPGTLSGARLVASTATSGHDARSAARRPRRSRRARCSQLSRTSSTRFVLSRSATPPRRSPRIFGDQRGAADGRRDQRRVRARPTRSTHHTPSG